MSEIQIPQGYTSLLSIYETQKAISLLQGPCGSTGCPHPCSCRPPPV